MRRNPTKRYLIQGLRPRHRNWETIDDADDENRALLKALHRARLGRETYRVWDTATVEEIWRGSGKDAKIDRWQSARPSGLVGANRRKAMLRNPRISPKMQPLRENTMRLGDAMKWGRRLLDAGVSISLWDGSGWEVYIKPDDSYATSSGRAAKGGRRYLAQGAGLIKRWPITMISPSRQDGLWLTPAAIRHFLAHRKAGAASNPGACRNPLCRTTKRRPAARRNDAPTTLADLDRRFNELARKLDSMKGTPREGTPEYMLVLKEMGVVAKKRLDVSGITFRRAGSNPRRAAGLRPKSVTVYCRMCGEWDPAMGPYKTATAAGWMTGKLACLSCRRGLAQLKRSKYDFKRERMPGGRRARRNPSAEENMRDAHDQIVSAFLDGRPKRMGERYWTDGRLLRVWGNLVAHKTDNGIRLSDAGFRTLLTKNVLNAVLEKLGAGHIYQKARQWYVGTPLGDVLWTGEWTVGRRPAVAPNRGRRSRRIGNRKRYRGNPLTRREAAKVLRQAHAELRHGSVFRPGHTRSSMAGQAFGRAQTVVQHGPRNARPAARRLIKRAVRSVGTTMSNPGAGLRGLMSNSAAKKAMRFS